jgi:hypothetical protein
VSPSELDNHTGIQEDDSESFRRVRAKLKNENDEQNGKEKNMNEEQGKVAFWWLVWIDLLAFLFSLFLFFLFFQVFCCC